MINSIQNNSVSFKGRLYGNLACNIVRDAKSKIVRPVEICSYGDVQMIRRINVLFDKDLVKIKQENIDHPFKKFNKIQALIFECSKADLLKGNFWHNNFIMQKTMNRYQKDFFNDKNSKFIAFELPVCDYNEIKTNSSNKIYMEYLKRFEETLRKHFPEQKEQQFIDKYFTNKTQNQI